MSLSRRPLRKITRTEGIDENAANNFSKMLKTEPEAYLCAKLLTIACVSFKLHESNITVNNCFHL